MAETSEIFRSWLTRQITLDEALAVYMGATPYDADAQADRPTTVDGMLMERLRDLVSILAIRETPAPLAMLVASLIWRSAPVATGMDQLREAMRVICEWRAGLNDAEVSRIIHAHAVYTERFEEAMRSAVSADCPEIDRILSDLAEGSHGDTVVAELGSCLLIIEMTDTDYFVGLQDETDRIIVIDRVPHRGGGGGPGGDDAGPVGPRPRLLIDA